MSQRTNSNAKAQDVDPDLLIPKHKTNRKKNIDSTLAHPRNACKYLHIGPGMVGHIFLYFSGRLCNVRSCPHGLDIRPTRPQCRWSSLWGSHLDQIRGQTQMVSRAGDIQLLLPSVSKFARTAYSSSFHEALQSVKTVIQLSGCLVVVEGVGSALCSYRKGTRNAWVTVIRAQKIFSVPVAELSRVPFFWSHFPSSWSQS